MSGYSVNISKDVRERANIERNKLKPVLSFGQYVEVALIEKFERDSKKNVSREIIK